MGHYCPPELLDDVADVLAEVRTWARVVEKQPGIFYVGRDPFLHFHLLAGGRRRADVKGGHGWEQIDLPRPAPGPSRRALLRTLRARHGERVVAAPRGAAALRGVAAARGVGARRGIGARNHG